MLRDYWQISGKLGACALVEWIRALSEAEGVSMDKVQIAKKARQAQRRARAAPSPGKGSDSTLVWLSSALLTLRFYKQLESTVLSRPIGHPLSAVSALNAKSLEARAVQTTTLIWRLCGCSPCAICSRKERLSCEHTVVVLCYCQRSVRPMATSPREEGRTAFMLDGEHHRSGPGTSNTSSCASQMSRIGSG